MDNHWKTEIFNNMLTIKLVRSGFSVIICANWKFFVTVQSKKVLFYNQEISNPVKVESSSGLRDQVGNAWMNFSLASL